MNFTHRLFQIGAEALETGLYLADGTLRTIHFGLLQLIDSNSRDASSDIQSRGSADVDAATSELANRLLRIGCRTRMHPRRLLRSGKDIGRAVRESFVQVNQTSRWRRLGALLELPLSIGTLTTQESLRTLLSARAVSRSQLFDFAGFVIELFNDLHVYFSLEYGTELQRYRRFVQDEPNNGQACLELGRTYMKCGLFDQALRELTLASEHPRVRQRALYESIVSLYKTGAYTEAVETAVHCLKIKPTDERAQHWLWLSAQKLGGYPAQVPRHFHMEVTDGYYPTQVELEEVAERIGLDKVSGGRGSAIFDSNGNGYLDIVVAGTHAGCSLFLNNGDGTFSDASVGSGLDRCQYGFSIAVGDYNLDGLPDLYISSAGFYNGQGRLMRNNGDGTFTDVSQEAGIDCWGPAFTATWVDYNLDGKLDLFIANNMGGLFDRKTPNRLFRNDGDGHFTDVTREAGLHTMWPTIGAAWGDINNDGNPDLFVSGLGRGQLFRNNGDGTFADISRRAGVDAPAIGSVALWWDIDDDGWLDIIQTTYSRPGDAIYTLRHGHGPPDGFPSRVFHNNRDGTFSLISRELGITGCWGTMSACAGDLNNDGFSDLMFGNGDASIDRTECTIILENDGRGRFHNVSFSAGVPPLGKGHGVNVADLAGDGRLHVIVAQGGLYPGDIQTTEVFRPKQLPGNYLNVRLVGRQSNPDAIGARLSLRAAGRAQHRLVSGGSNFGCMPYEQHFGLASATSCESLEVAWPSGLRQQFAEPPINSTISIVEGQNHMSTVRNNSRSR